MMVQNYYRNKKYFTEQNIITNGELKVKTEKIQIQPTTLTSS